MRLRTFTAKVLFLTLTFGLLSGCVRKPATTTPAPQKANLVFYSLFDNEDIYLPLIQQYESKNPGVTITYRKFTDPVQYQNTIINELAEGQGPDIFAAPNYWFLSNVRKLSPLSPQTFSPAQFQQTFVDVASNDLIQKDPSDGQQKVYGLPMYVDTLALYYNKAAYNAAIPSQGKPSTTWANLENDVYTLSKPDNSFERFAVAGIAMGRSDNILRAMDILYLLMLQYKISFYNGSYTQTAFANQEVTDATGLLINPATEALRLYTSFAIPTNKNYSWNQYLATPNSALEEIDTFAKGKVAMIFGYSYLYAQIQAEIKALQSQGVNTIDPNSIQITAAPQINDPASSTETPVAYANYYAMTVARTSAHPDIAWDFLGFMTSKANLQYYNSKTQRPTSRRDLLTTQMQDPIYGVFDQQTGYAKSLPIYDYGQYQTFFSQAIDSVLGSTAPGDATKTAAQAIDAILPPEGMIPAASTNTSTSSQQSS